ncbi:hypothetical protein G5S35_17440 [Paraburkholderia tropica]|uniref:hypothetical protein n=1 Tax=Paraburkholderia tropica TaxID=92647 RepID=UPI001603D461|nr:hypothetical protein [Paraburkholderia tropica]QNB13417.1 hypothetical protein G5S35_17440 [Paraburkholderia tropica]
MIRAALAALALSGCTVIEHVQVLPTINPDTYDVSCCVAYAEIPPSTRLSVTVKKSTTSFSIKAGARWQF